MIASSADTPARIAADVRVRPLPRLDRPRRAAAVLLACLAAALGGCAVINSNHPHNLPAADASSAPARAAPGVMQAASNPDSDVVVALSFSGGGLRAAAFAAGAMQGLASEPGP